MVRKIIAILAMCGALLAIGAAPALADPEIIIEETPIYNNIPVMTLSEEESLELYALSVDAYQGTISTTYLTFFKDIVAGISIFDDYLFYRSSDNTYTLVVGDLKLNGTTFVLDGTGVEYEISQNSGSGYNNSYYSLGVSSVSDLTIRARDYLVYSNLGHYPRLEERGVVYEFALLTAFIVFGVCCLVRPISNFVLRFRNGN